MARKRELTKKEFENLLIKASQPVQGQALSPDSKVGETSEPENSGDCSGKNTRSDNSGDI